MPDHLQADQRAVLLDLLVAAARIEPLALEETLEHLITGAARLVGARYAAIGVVDEHRPGRLALFVHTGMPEELVRRLGHPPVGRGLLGSMLLRTEALRLRDLREHPDFTGFPPGHPPMGSFLGVPVRAHGETYGHLYLTEKLDAAEFSVEDERAAALLAATSAAKIVQTRRYGAERTRAAWLDATVSLTSTLVGSDDPLEALGAVCSRARSVAGADLAWLEVTSAEGTSHTWVSREDETLEYSEDSDLAAGHRALADRVAQSDAPARSGVAGSERLMVVPLSTRSGRSGTLGLAWTPSSVADIERLPTELPASLARQAALALEIAESRRDRRRIEILEERNRIARDLHDLVLQQLFAVKLGIESVASRMDDPAHAPRLGELAAELQDTIVEMRRTIFGLGWQGAVTEPTAAVRAVVERAGGVLKLRPTLRLSGPLDSIGPTLATDLVAVLAESVSNVARHARAGAVSIDIRVDDHLTAVVDDDGVGMPESYRQGGLRNLEDRARAHGGRCTVDPSPSGGTRVVWRVPLDGADVGRSSPRQ